MAILNRLQRLFRADLHAILDSIEDPQTVLKQAIREMEEALDRKRARLTRTEKARQALQASCLLLGRRLEQVEQDLELAQEQHSAELTRKMIGRKLGLHKQLHRQQGQLAALGRTWQDLSDELKTQQQHYDSILEKAELVIPPVAEDSPESVAEAILNSSYRLGRDPEGFQVSQEEIELEWLRLQQQKGGKS